MPKNKPALSVKEGNLIFKWIQEGAKFDGDDLDKTTTVDKLAKGETAKPMKPEMKVEIPKATGTEKVSFTRDIAPFMVNLCLRCHSGGDPRGGLSLVTFERMMRGGDSGAVILPGKMEESRLFRLVGGLENPRMPQGQARITRKNYEDLKTWFKEGNKYDGGDPKKLLRDLVPTEEELKREKYAKFSASDYEELRLLTSQEQWTKTLPKEEAVRAGGKEFMLFGNVKKERLDEINRWAEEEAKQLRELFGEKAGLLWKGKLAIFVFKTRFGFDEFNLSVEDRRVPAKVIGFANVDPMYEQAYIVLQNVEDEPTSESPGMRNSLSQQMSVAYLMRSKSKIPDWVAQGTGYVLASKRGNSNEFLDNKAKQVPDILKTITRADDIFKDNTFSPADVSAVGYALVNFLIKQGGGGKKFGQFVERLGRGDKLNDAFLAVYKQTSTTIATQFAASLQQPQKKKKKKKR